MPHAVPRQPSFAFNLPHRGSDKYHLPSSSATRYGQLTPPEEMNGSLAHAPSHHGLAMQPDLRQAHGFSTAYPHHGYAAQPPTLPHPHTLPPISQQSQGPAIRVEGDAQRNSSQPMGQQAVERRTSFTPAVAPSLQIPKSIKTPHGSIAELAADITCLFWFESSQLLKHIEKSPHGSQPTGPLTRDAKPSPGFRKWVTTILTTTMVSQEVVLLALLFICRLKKINPTVQGKVGSEFRLLTVALMMGNKYLDDNTYTNKTWADVSGIAVGEVHIMEVEFLSNMKYNLFVAAETWESWYKDLGLYGTYIDKATKVELNSTLRVSPQPSSYSTLPSPPASNNASPPFAAMYSPHRRPHSNTPLLQPQRSSNVVSPIGPLPELNFQVAGRKRSTDDRMEEPAPKRPNFGQTQHHPHLPSLANSRSNVSTPGHLPTLPRLPTLTIPSNQLNQPPLQQAPQLPPPNPAMSTVYPPPMSLPQPLSMPGSLAPTLPTAMAGPSRDHSRQVSPFPRSAGSSPTSASFPQGVRHSPMVFPQRSSPYGPFRYMQTLAAPPPTSMHNPPHIPMNQMQYQTIGKYTDRRFGPLPYEHRGAMEPVQYTQYPGHATPGYQPNFVRY